MIKVDDEFSLKRGTSGWTVYQHAQGNHKGKPIKRVKKTYHPSMERAMSYGCVWNMEEAFSMNKMRLGSRLSGGADLEIITPETRERELEYMASAVTELANDPARADLARTVEIENAGGKVLSFTQQHWSRIVNAVTDKVAA